MRRGEIRVADLEPVRGAQANKRRPVVIVSNDAANRRAEALGRGIGTVVPLTSNVSRVLPFQLLVPPADSGLSRPSKAQAEQVRSIAVERLGARVGRLPAASLQALDLALRLHLQL
jgi:mRNA interferase MazF